MVTITHSGHTFTALGFDETCQAYIWPIQEYLVRRKHKKSVAERIERLNRAGKTEGERPRGWHPKANLRTEKFMRDCDTLRAYENRWGTREGAEIVGKCGRHKLVSRPSFENGPT